MYGVWWDSYVGSRRDVVTVGVEVSNEAIMSDAMLTLRRSLFPDLQLLYLSDFHSAGRAIVAILRFYDMVPDQKGTVHAGELTAHITEFR